MTAPRTPCPIRVVVFDGESGKGMTVRPELKPAPKPERPKVSRNDNEPPPKWWERGQALAEYALILALIVIVAVVVLSVLGVNIASALSHVGESI